MAARILVVDDQRTNAEMVSGVLRNLGYEVEVALDAETCWHGSMRPAPSPAHCHGAMRLLHLRVRSEAAPPEIDRD